MFRRRIIHRMAKVARWVIPGRAPKRVGTGIGAAGFPRGATRRERDLRLWTMVRP
jgi:hypothetical protein